MDKAKDSVRLLNELQVLSDARKLMGVRVEINDIIADTVDEFFTALNAKIDDEIKKVFEPSDAPKKSEMPCNCKQEKSLQSVIASMAKTEIMRNGE